MTAERLLISEAAAILPGLMGVTVHIGTLRRWIAKGVLVKGKRIKLRSERIGGRTYTTREWVNSFVKECSDWTEPENTVPRLGTPPEVLMRLKARGFDGPQEKNKVLGLRKPVRTKGALPAVLPKRSLCDANSESHGTAVG